jgi:phosphoglycolate phosphatase/pyrophosphatase PpaX
VRALIKDGWQEAVAMFLAEYEASHHLCPGPFPGILETLEQLRAEGVPMAVVTGKSDKSAEISFRHIPVRQYFDSVTTGSHTHNAKREGIERAVARWKLRPSEVAYVGDAPGDVEQSKLAGVTPLSAFWGSTVFTREQLLAAGPATVLERPQDVVTWVRNGAR